MNQKTCSHIQHRMHGEEGAWHVVCAACGLTGSVRYTRDLAAEAWKDVSGVEYVGPTAPNPEELLNSLKGMLDGGAQMARENLEVDKLEAYNIGRIADAIEFHGIAYALVAGVPVEKLIKAWEVLTRNRVESMRRVLGAIEEQKKKHKDA